MDFKFNKRVPWDSPDMTVFRPRERACQIWSPYLWP